MMVLSVQTSPGRNLPLDAPVASTRHTQIALASCFVGITSKISKYITARKTIRHWTGNAVSSILIDWGFCHLSLLPTTLQDCLNGNKSQSFLNLKTVQSSKSHSVHSKLRSTWDVEKWRSETLDQIHHWNSTPASTSLEAYQFHELRSPNQLP